MMCTIEIPVALRAAAAEELAKLLPYSHPIMGYRNRSVENRGVTCQLLAAEDEVRRVQLLMRSLRAIIQPTSYHPTLLAHL